MSEPRGLRRPCARALAPLVLAVVAACGDDGGTTPPIDAGPTITTAHCSFEPVAANAGAGTSAAAAPLMAGAAEAPLDVPVGTALGGYTARGAFLGMADKVDNREVPLAGGFFPSVGVHTRPMAKALALRAGGETVVWIKVDAIFAYEGFVFDLEQRLGPEYRGKILLSTSHSHAAWAQYTAHSPLKVGASERRKLVGDRWLAGCEAAARAAIADLRPAKLGVATDTNFDPADAVTRERRGENDVLPGGNRKDDRLHLIRVDATDGAPIAIVPIFGMHGTLGDADNPLASTDASGGIEGMLAEQFDREVVVMQVQSAGADVSPSGHGSLDCNVHPGNPRDPCFGNFLASEGNGRAALPILMAAWTTAGASMSDTLALSMVTRSIELGPKPETFAIRGGSLAYAPFDLERQADRVVYDGAGALASPIDEYNAPVGAALCESETAMFPAAAMPNVDGLKTYGSCVRLDIAGDIIGQLLRLDLSDVTAEGPACQTTRTTLSALRLGDYLIATMPGELSVLLSDKLRAASPVDSAHTITVGYSQGHVGYMLTPEDWLLGGYEPSVSFWGPLEAEYIV
ncbi:MAG: neutral/alkaline non-lysosomal ceramidase N-terminal domain-containing protein, partial [Kofleriaceae bacterium]|nr:neutral/alkaline non-lysosomal ceramidase N-terminal domain-containing protein [Kofleriaceae bacterium]